MNSFLKIVPKLQYSWVCVLSPQQLGRGVFTLTCWVDTRSTFFIARADSMSPNSNGPTSHDSEGHCRSHCSPGLGILQMAPMVSNGSGYKKPSLRKSRVDKIP